MSTESVALKLGAAADVAYALEECCIRYGITTTLQKAHFLGQMAQESQGYTKVRENMMYSASRMAQVWPSRYAVNPKAPIRARQPNAKAIALAKAGPEAIANDVYGGRMGNTQPGDGWAFIGRGYKMLTGRNNYTRYSLDTYGDARVLLDPAMLERLPDAVFTGGWYWQTNNIGPHADRDNVLAVSRAVNLGNANSTATPIGLAQRRDATERAKALFAEMVDG